jgi:hypothetical protein
MSTFQCLKVAQIRMLRTMTQLLAVMMAHVSMTSSRRRRKGFWLIVSISARRAKTIIHD